jgi:hypothetical protein
MSIQLTAPYPTYTGSIILPNPALGDGQSRTFKVQLHRAMDNTTYTHVKKSLPIIFDYSFELTHIKALELLDFFKDYVGSIWRMSAFDISALYYQVVLLENQLELNNFKRSVYEGHSLETISINLTFESIVL